MKVHPLPALIVAVILLLPISMLTIDPLTSDTDDTIPSLILYEPAPTSYPDRIVTNEGYFVENIGQYAAAAGSFYAIGRIMSVSFGEGWMAYHPTSGDDVPTEKVHVVFVGSYAIGPQGVDVTKPTMSFLSGRGRDDWFLGARSFREVVYTELWEGISLRYFFADGKLKYEFEVLPGADPSLIRLRYEGADRLFVDESSGDLVVSMGPATFTDEAPVAFQTVTGHEREVPCEYILSDDSTVGFEAAAYDVGNTLVIDPGVVFSTFLGGTNGEVVNDIWVDEEDDYSLITGTTQSGGFPDTPAGFQHGDRTTDWHYLVRMDENASRIEYVVLLTLTRMNMITDIYVDDLDCVYLTGFSGDGNFPTTIGAYMQSRPGVRDAFLMKLDPSGTEVLYSTMFGGDLLDSGLAVWVDREGTAYVVGSTNSTDLPVTDDAFQSTWQGEYDAFVAKFNPNGSELLYSTYLGGSSLDYANNLELESDGSLYLAGTTESTDLPVTARAIEYRNSGGTDVFLGRLNMSRPGLEYLSYIGGDEDDVLSDMDIDAEGDLYLVGTTRSGDFPTTEGAFDREINFTDGFALKVSTGNWSLAYSTFLGGSSGDVIEAVSVNPSGRASVVGDTISRDLPTTPDAHCSTYNDDGDILLMVLDSSGTSLVYSTYLGGALGDEGVDCESPTDGVIYVAGATMSTTYTTTEGAYCATHNGYWDVFLTKFDISPPLADAGDDMTVGIGEAFTMDASGSSDNLGIINWTWNFEYAGDSVRLHREIVGYTFDTLGVFTVTLTVTDAVGHQAMDILTITVVDTTPPVADAGPDIEMDQGEEASFDASLSTDNIGITGAVWAFAYEGESTELRGTTTFFLFEVPGVYLVTVNVSDAVGNWDTDELEVTVRDIMAPVADAGLDIEIDQSEYAPLDGSGSMDNVAISLWTWTFEYDGRMVTLEGEVVDYVFEIPGVYIVSFQVADAAGNGATDSVEVIVHDIEAPSVVAGEDVTIKAGEEVQFNGTGSMDNVVIAEMVWTFVYKGKVVRLNEERPLFKFKDPGSYLVTLEATDGEGNSGSDSMVVTVVKADEDGLPYLWIVILVILVIGVIVTIVLIRSRVRS
jgi:hypothetical protein